MKLDINGRIVEVDDSFANLSPEDQNVTVEEIAASFDAQQAPEPEIPQIPQEESDIPVIEPPQAAAPVQPPQQPRLEDMQPIGGAQEAIIEPALTIGTSLASLPLAGLSGIYAGLTGGDMRGAVEGVQEKMTYQPRTQVGEAALAGIGGLAELTGVPKAMEMAKERWGEAGYQAGGAGLGAVTQAVPDIVLTLLGYGATKNAPKIKNITQKATQDATKGVEDAVKVMAGRPEIRVYDESGQFSREALDLLDKKAEEGVDVDAWVSNYAANKAGLSPEDAKRMAENLNVFRRRGVEPTRANITQATTDWKLQQDAIKETGDLSRLIANQDEALAQLAREGKAKIGAEYSDYASANNSLASVVVNIRETADQAVSNAYKAAEKKAPKKPIVALNDFGKQLKKSIPANTRSGGLIDNIIGDLDSRGIIDKNTLEPKARISPQTAESVRQDLNRLYKDTEGDLSTAAKASRSIISQLKDAIDNDVARDVGVDLFKDARAQKIKASKLLGRERLSKYDVATRNLLEDISENNIPEGQIIQKIVKTNRPEEFNMIYEFYTKRSGDAGISAFNNMKAAIVEDAITKATGAAGEGGIRAFNTKAYKKVFDELRSAKASSGKDAPSRYEVMFSPEERALIEDIEKIGELRTPARHVPQGSGPSGKAIFSASSQLLERIGVPKDANIAQRINQMRIEKKALEIPEKEIQSTIERQRQAIYNE